VVVVVLLDFSVMVVLAVLETYQGPASLRLQILALVVVAVAVVSKAAFPVELVAQDC
jgi:hypothetical protein